MVGHMEDKEANIEKQLHADEAERRKKSQIGNEKGVAGVEIVDEMESAYIDYAMSVIVQRALPSVEDGMKPVHRRILYAMHDIGLVPSKPTKKSAAVVGEVLGKYHPHGDTSVYDAMVRMGQYWSLRYPLVKGQGNFGSMDGDSPAAMRYTEAKMSKISGELMQDIEKETVKMNPNFDNSHKEPDILPGKLPTLLLNGATGIAVGMATNIPPHNMTEVCDAIVSYINKPEITIDALADIVTGPDFPTGGVITSQGLKEMYKTGKGRVTIRGRTNIEEKNGKKSIIVTEIPYMVNKSDMIKKIALLATEKKFPDVSDLRDESSKGKVRIVIEMKKGTDPKFTLNKLFKLTNLQSNFDTNLVALVKKQPRLLNLKNVIEEYVNHRKDVVKKRSKFELKKAEDRLEIVIGLLLALKNIDQIVDFIKKSASSSAAHEGLMKKFDLTTRQAKAVLEMKLSQLTKLEDGKLKEEKAKLEEIIKALQKILGSEQEILGVIKKEVAGLKKDYGDDRRTKIIRKIDDISEQDMVEKKDVIVMLTEGGYLKRVDMQSYKEQKRGGAGVTGGQLKEEDFVRQMVTCSTHDYLLFFTDRGRVYWLKAVDAPAAERQGKGKAIVNVLQLREEKITNAMALKNFESGSLMFGTKLGIIKKLSLMDLSKPRSTGVRAINLPSDGSDSLVNVRRVEGGQEILMTSKKGQAIRFNASDVREMGRASYGVKGIDLGKGDEVVGLEVIAGKGKESILTVTDRGYGKRTAVEDYRKTSRGGKGVINLKVGDKVGEVIGSLEVNDKDSVILTTTKGMVVRINMKQLRVMGRATQGVRVVNLKVGDRVADSVRVPREEEVLSEAEEEK
jgi:DNA gyrase subunit A